MARLSEIKENIRLGQGPQSIKEKRDILKAERQAEQDELERQKFENYSFGELMAVYLQWAATNKRHQNDEYRYRLHLAPQLADVPLRKISPFMLEKVKKTLQDKGLAPATVKHCIVIVRQAFNKAIVWGTWHGENPVRHVKMPRLDNRKERVLSEEEERVFMPALKDKSPVTWGMAMTALYGGLRYEEITKIHWQQVDFDRNLLHVDGKGGKKRIVPLNDTLRAVFDEFKPATLQAARSCSLPRKARCRRKSPTAFGAQSKSWV